MSALVWVLAVGIVALVVAALGNAVLRNRAQPSVTVTEACIVVGCDDAWHYTGPSAAAARVALARLSYDHAERWHPEILNTPAGRAATDRPLPAGGRRHG